MIPVGYSPRLRTGLGVARPPCVVDFFIISLFSIAFSASPFRLIFAYSSLDWLWLNLLIYLYYSHPSITIGLSTSLTCNIKIKLKGNFSFSSSTKSMIALIFDSPSAVDLLPKCFSDRELTELRIIQALIESKDSHQSSILLSWIFL